MHKCQCGLCILFKQNMTHAVTACVDFELTVDLKLISNLL